MTTFYEEIGGFDERFFLYFEDVDLCLRLRRASVSRWISHALNVPAEIAVRVVSAQKDQVKKAHEVPPADAPDLSQLPDAELAQLEATLAKVGTRLPTPASRRPSASRPSPTTWPRRSSARAR